MIKKLYNPNANTHNLLVIHDSDSGCCGSDAQECTYTSAGIATLGATALKVEIDGVEQTLSFGATASTQTALYDAIKAALATIGYDVTEKDWLTFDTIEANTIVILKGELKIVALVNSGDVAFTSSCDA